MNVLLERKTDNFRFPGQYFIEETGLYYNWWRWYENEMGRYMETDPINKYVFNREQENSYIYGLCNPIVYTDLKGRELDYKDISTKCFPSMRGEIKKSYDEICKNGANEKFKRCLPADLYDKLKKGCGKHLEVECTELTDGSKCAQHPIGSYRIIFYRNYDSNICGCIESIFMHELLHYGGENSDNRTLACEIKCYGKNFCKREMCSKFCAGNCK